MHWYEILAIVILAAFFIVISAITIYNNIKGKSSCAKECSGQCGSCGHVCSCHKSLVDEYHKLNTDK